MASKQSAGVALTEIGTNDLWIAATARAHELPVVTRNLREYGRVPGVRTLGY